MRRIILIFLLAIFSIVTLVILLYWRTGIVDTLIKDLLNQNLSQVIHLEYESISGDLFRNITLTGVTATLKDGPVIKSNHLNINYDLLSSASNKYQINSILFDSLNVFWSLPRDTLLQIEEENSSASFEALLDRWAASSFYDSLFASLPEIFIGRLKIIHGKLEIPNSKFTLDSVLVDLSAYVNPESFEVKVDHISAKWLEKNLTLKDLHFQLLGKPERITLNQLRINTSHSIAHCNGEIDISDDLVMILNLEEIHLDIPEINTIVGYNNLDSGFIHLSSQFVGSPNRFSAQLIADGSINNYKLDSLEVDWDYRQGEIILNRGKILANQSHVLFNGKILKESNEINILFKNFNVNLFLPNSIPTDLNGALYVQTKELNFKNLTGQGKLSFHDSSIDSIKFDSLEFAINAHNSNFVINEPSFLKLAEQSRFTIKGGLSRDKQLDINLYTENNSIDTLTKILHLNSLSGYFDGNLFFTGKLFDPNLEGYIWIPYLHRNQLVMDSLILQIKLEEIMTQRHGDAYLSARKGQFGPINFTEIRSDLIFKGNTIYIDTLLFAKDVNYFSTSGYLTYTTKIFNLGLDFFRIYYENYWIENEGQVLFRFDSTEISIEQAIFKAPDDGLIELRGLWDKNNDDMDVGMYLRNIIIDPFNQFLQTDTEFSGVLEGDIQVINPLTQIEIDVAINGENLFFNKIPFGTVKCAFQIKEKNIYISEFKMSQDGSLLKLDGDVAMHYVSEDEKQSVGLLGESMADVKISWQDINLQNYSPLINLPRPIIGKFSGSLLLSGSMRSPHGIITLVGEDLRYDKFFSDSLKITGKFNKDSLLIEHLYADLNGTSIQGSGWQSLNLDLTTLDTLYTRRPLELHLRSQDNAMEFIGYLTDQVERISGPFEIDVWLTGSLAHPSLNRGRIKLRDGVLELSRVRNPLTNVKIDAEIENSILTIRNFRAEAAKKKDLWESSMALITRLIRLFGGKTKAEGVVDLHGSIDLSNLTHPRLDLGLDMYKLYIDYFIENTNMVLTSSDLKISGRDTLMVTGSMEVDEGLYVVDLAKLQKNIYLTQTGVEQARTLAWNLDITMPGNFIIRSSKLDLINNFQFEISGDIRTIQEPYAENMELTGYMDIISGKYGSWGQDFEIQSGNINFTDPNQINPEINIRAEKRSRGYTFELSITGNLEKQQISLQVKDEDNNYLNYSDSDKLTLLTLGTMTSQLQAADLATAGGDVITTSVETAFSRGAESITGLDKVELDLQTNVIDLQSLKLNNGLQDASISFGKYLTSNLYLEYRSKLGEGTIPVPKLNWVPGNQIFLEYRFNKNWSIDSFYQQTQRGNNKIKLSLSWKTTF